MVFTAASPPCNSAIEHIKFSPGMDGQVEVWFNGLQVVSNQGATAFKDGESLIYNKFGLYRDRLKEPMTIYFDMVDRSGILNFQFACHDRQSKTPSN